MFLVFAEDEAKERHIMTMQDWLFKIRNISLQWMNFITNIQRKVRRIIMNKYNLEELTEKLERCRNVTLDDVILEDVK